MPDDREDVELLRLAVWTILAAGALSATDPQLAVQCADEVLEAAQERFPILRLPPADPLDLV